MKKILIPIGTLFICFLLFWSWTKGFSSFTVFSTTLKKAGPLPRPFPEVTLRNQDSALIQIKDFKHYVLINFVYLNCPYVCHKVNNRLENIYKKLGVELIPSNLELLTISFDTKNDNIEKIRNYRKFFVSGRTGWTFAMPTVNKSDFDKTLQRIGVWAEESPQTHIINHSIYLFLVSPDHEIIKVFDPARESDESIALQLSTCLKK